MTSGTDAGRLVVILARLRRRAVVALAVRYICAAATVTLLVGEAVLMASPAYAGPRALLGGLALAAGVAGAAAWFRAPAVRETAHAVDRRLRLQNRLVTAFQYRDATDEFSRLVVRDALAHADDIRPALAFPLRIPGWVRFAAVAACAAPLVFVLARDAVPEFWQRASTGDASAPGALSIPSAAGNRDETATPEANAGAAVDGAPRVAVEATPVPQEAGNRGPLSERTPGNVDSSTPRTAAAETGGRGVPAGARSGSGRAGGTPRGAPAEGGGAGRGNGNAGSSQTAQAGGLTGEPGSDTDAARARRGAEPARDPAYRSAWSTSQRAIAQEHIPSALREYVRQYFLAIRPVEAP
jgi:hypothetical protein